MRKNSPFEGVRIMNWFANTVEIGSMRQLAGKYYLTLLPFFSQPESPSLSLFRLNSDWSVDCGPVRFAFCDVSCVYFSDGSHFLNIDSDVSKKLIFLQYLFGQRINNENGATCWFYPQHLLFRWRVAWVGLCTHPCSAQNNIGQHKTSFPPIPSSYWKPRGDFCLVSEAS